MKVADKVAVVAGVGHPVSDAVARRLMEEGARVVVGGEDPNALLRTSGELYGWPPKPHTLVCMEPDEAQGAEDLVQAALQTFGQLDIAVCAWQQPGRGPLHLARAAARAMQPRGCGRIVNVSTRDRVEGPAETADIAARASIVGLTRQLARELGQHGIAVNCVASGLIPDEQLQGAAIDEIQDLLPAQAVHGPETAADLAEAVLFLASDEAQSITGQILYLGSRPNAVSPAPAAEPVSVR